jgi:hypothetical protein
LVPLKRADAFALRTRPISFLPDFQAGIRNWAKYRVGILKIKGEKPKKLGKGKTIQYQADRIVYYDKSIPNRREQPT